MTEYRDILINFLEQDNEGKEKLVNSLPVILILTILVISMGFGYRLKKAELAVQQQLNSNLKSKIQTCSEELNAFAPHQELQKELAAGKEILGQLNMQKKSYAKTLEYFSSINGTALTLTAIKLEENTVEIEGLSCNNSDVINYAEQLIKNHDFSGILNLSTAIGNNSETTAFNIILKWGETE